MRWAGVNDACTHLPWLQVIKGNEAVLAPAALTLLEGGAYSAHTDAVVSANKWVCRLERVPG